jgi:hypothetical protein
MEVTMIDPNRYDVSKCASLRSAQQQLADRIKSIRENAAYQESDANNQFAILQAAADRYHKQGIAKATTKVSSAANWLFGGTAREFFQQIANELERPLVLAETDHYGIMLTVPKSKAMQNIVAPLLLVIEPGDVALRYRATEATRSESAARWKFFFPGAKKDQFKQFCEMCRTNPVARMILKIPK